MSLLVGLLMWGIPVNAQSPVSQPSLQATATPVPPSEERCLSCHTGIEEASASHPKTLGCVVCHGGDGAATGKEGAHASLIYDPASGTGKRNPSALRVVKQSCGRAECHGGLADSDRNHADRMRKSMMGSLSGMIAGLRYQWAGQAQQTARYGVYAVTDRDGQVPEDEGALNNLDALPYFSPGDLEEAHRKGAAPFYGKISGHIGDKLLREQCFGCHLDAPPPAGTYRSQGCAACHFNYARDGLYRGGDSTVSTKEPGHPAYHQITALPPRGVCTQCHRGYLAETRHEDSSRQPWNLMPALGIPDQDIHFSAGLECIDCHTDSDIMGDGNIYSRQFQAVEIRCENCHGTGESNPLIAKITDPNDPAVRISRHYAGFRNEVGDHMALSARKRKLGNVKVRDKKLIALSKRTGREHALKFVKGKTRYIHDFPGHKDKLACTACHSSWVPRCDGCHSAFSGATGERGSWAAANFNMTLEEPSLMVGPRGQVVPMLSQPHRTLTVLDEEGHPVPVIDRDGDSPGAYREWHFTNPAGRSGSNLAYGMAPHSVGRKVRSCSSCHLSPKTLGLGEGQFEVGRSPSGKRDGIDPAFKTHRVTDTSIETPEAKVTMRGQPIAGTGQPGARPFNQEEISRILRVGNCIPCHNRYSDKIYRNMEESYAFERKVRHRDLRNKILNRR